MKVRRRIEVNAEKRTRAGVMREWLQDRIAAVQKRKATERELIEQSEREGGGHGVTVAMRNIRGSEPVWLIKHEQAPSRNRRHFRGDDGKIHTWPRGLRDPGGNLTYVNPGRDLKRKRRLRKELRGEQSGS